MAQSCLQSLPLLLLTVLVLLVCANASMVFRPAELRCDPILPTFQGCLRGQRCTRRGFCEIPVNEDEVGEDDASLETRSPSTRAVKRGFKRVTNTSNIPELGTFPENDRLSGTSLNLISPKKPHQQNFGALNPLENERPSGKVYGNEATEEDPVLCGASHDDKICTNNACCSPYGVRHPTPLCFQVLGANPRLSIAETPSPIAARAVSPGLVSSVIE